jgi:type VII secretion protein EccB
MATKRDLVEAHSFSRRRLVTAFVSGAPGGREVEPVRPGRSLIGGVALSVLLLAGALIAGIFSPRVDDNWRAPGLIVSKPAYAQYVITGSAEPLVVHPVINNTSALLIAGDAARDPTLVPQELIDQQVAGEALGIVGAPSVVPAATELIPTGWTACTSTTTGIRLSLSTSPGADPEPGGALVVRDAVSGADYLLAHEGDPSQGQSSVRSYALPTQGAARDQMLSLLGLPSGAEATEVSPQWLALVPPGGPLGWDSARVEGAGEPVGYAEAVYPGARVGDLVHADGRDFVLQRGGPAPLSDFAAVVYASLPAPHTPRQRTMPGLPNRQFQPPAFADAQWPTGGLQPVSGESCVQLVAAAGQPAYAVLVAAPDASASSAEVGLGRRQVVVDSGRGAFVESGDWDRVSSDSRFLVDASGRAYPLEGIDTPALLGYADIDPPVVPDSWVALLDRGVVLSQEAALCPPDPEGGSSCP